MKLDVKLCKKLREFELMAEFSVDSCCVGFTGPSGSGKSMLLKCIAGIETPDSGRIMLGDRILFDSEKKINLPPRKRNVGYLFQNYALFPNMTVEKNIQSGLKAAGIEKKEREKRTMQMLQLFRLEQIRDCKPDRISGGQKQRTALARMLVCRPEAILMDEPCSALDEELREYLQKELGQLLLQFDCPSILVSHDSNEVRMLCKERYRMKAGHLLGLQDEKEKE